MRRRLWRALSTSSVFCAATIATAAAAAPASETFGEQMLVLLNGNYAIADPAFDIPTAASCGPTAQRAMPAQ